MELRQLKYFMEACELQNFSEAARQLHISQSTLSHQIKQLEDELDILLFDRIGKRVIPTEAGNAFLPFARKSIQDAENGRQIIRDLKGIETGILHIGATYSLSPLLISAMKLFAKTYPGIKVLVTLATSAELIDRLKDNSLDFILSFDAEEWPAELERLPLFTFRLCFIVHQSHSWAGLSSITLKKLEQAPLILPEKGFATRKKLDSICRKHQLKLKVGIEINDVHTIIHTLSGGYWSTILTEAAVRGEPNLVCIPILYTDHITSKAFLFWPQGIYRKKSALAFAACLQQEAKEGMKYRTSNS